MDMVKQIVCFGDSNTHGYDSASGGRLTESQRYPCLLEAYLGTGYRVKEEGLSGRTCVFEDPLFEGLNGLSSIYPCLMTHEPVDLLTIMLGTNDTKARFGCNGENISKGLIRLVQKALGAREAFRKEPNILIICPPPIEEGYEATFIYPEMGPGCVEKSRELSKFYKEAAKKLGCHFLDAGQIPGIHMHPNDFMHLDVQSHSLLAKTLAQLIPSLC